VFKRVFIALALLTAVVARPAAAGQIAEVSAEGMRHIVAPPQMPAMGAKQARITIVEYLDYNCPYCRKIAPDLVKLAKRDHRVRVLFKDWPIFGGVSVYAARAAIAANYQGKYLAAHHALISTPERLTSKEQVRSALKKAGIDLRRLAADMKLREYDIDAAIARNKAEARALGLQGTPALIFGDLLVPGAVSFEGMQKLVNIAARPARH
jgi:protein-disulfide isomerase